MIINLMAWTNVAFLFLRIMLAIVFISSGIQHMRDPKGRSKSIGMSPLFTFALGGWEVLGSVSLLIGLWAQVGAAMVLLVMLGGLQKQIFVWHKPFFEGSNGGWHYELLLACASLVIVTTAGGSITLVH